MVSSSVPPLNHRNEHRPHSSGDALTDDVDPTQEEPSPKKPSAQILRHELKEALDAIDRSTSRLLVSAVAAGLELGFSLLLMARMHTVTEGRLPPAVEELLVANMYAFGFVLVVIGRSELFTEQTSLAVMPVLMGKASIRQLARLWCLVLAGNMMGAAVAAGFIVLIGPALGVVDTKVFGTLAQSLVSHPGWVIVGSAILAGWLMGLLSWLVAAGRDTISQIVIVWGITTAIGLVHLHHVVAGSVEVFAGLLTSAAVDVRSSAAFLFWAALGNAVGGAFFVALLKFAIAHPHQGGEGAS